MCQETVAPSKGPASPYTQQTEAPVGEKRVEMRVGDRVYDVTQFVKRHPGGSVIAYYAQQDATDAFDAFHQRSDKAKKVLNSLPSRPVADHDAKSFSAGDRAFIEDFRSFRQELIDEGYFDPSYAHVAYRLVELVAMFVLHFWLLSIGRWGLAAIVGGIATGRAGWVQHEGGHNSLTGIPWIDKAIQRVAIAFGVLTYGWKWNDTHNRHHATPQKVDHDFDIDTLPFVAFYKEALQIGRNRKSASKQWLKYQHWSFLPISAGLTGFAWAFYLHPKSYLLKKSRRDLVTFVLVVLRLVAHYLCCPAGWSLLPRVMSFVLTGFIGGMYLFGNFSVSHTHLPVTFRDENRNWVEYGINYTMNVDPNPVVSWWMGYLNCQIEHHLFPSMPQFRQTKLTHRTRAFCEKHGLNYQSMNYFQAVKATLMNLKHVADHISAADADKED
ncbi:unnamed protein product [Vitrella brassicaformis CCMP3155]|uniref:Cytochrome b5 heme-binding domain-containing protein n=2 Tax=Vitrella brassicaformis TaxID=1169539 RepID=A0A0G4GF57_VITBC|nr:unnamed protein product [Vitrella brassicaformis CCMP3155]|mmetsp:Transcript_22944/g.56691  ORF Transcript_22944/g.56691 Transcript_22944/m.56691 type:complete len:440 (+) Transcript_22944:22-1341(+)|eukprot:CEM28175.1 unnamed protein product [Vitrella brassicaformis CCMP3155]